MDELVSIIMPSYNTANYIAASIQSVLDQTYQNWELLLVDDALQTIRTRSSRPFFLTRGFAT